ncbi:MAG: hypothetical protein M3552_15675 [Planctomycetota bacterium]|nr:hypothetical protein [Planctomycetota bacterium]
MLSRDGRFARSADGDLITADGGFQVLSSEGTAIRLNSDSTAIEIGDDGTIHERTADGELLAVARLGIVAPEDQNAVQKAGDNLYRPLGNVRPVEGGTRVVQGFVEGSGVNPVLETMRMIEASRGFETNLNMIKFQDESLARLLTAARP